MSFFDQFFVNERDDVGSRLQCTWNSLLNEINYALLISILYYSRREIDDLNTSLTTLTILFDINCFVDAAAGIVVISFDK